MALLTIAVFFYRRPFQHLFASMDGHTLTTRMLGEAASSPVLERAANALPPVAAARIGRWGARKAEPLIHAAAMPAALAARGRRHASPRAGSRGEEVGGRRDAVGRPGARQPARHRPQGGKAGGRQGPAPRQGDGAAAQPAAARRTRSRGASPGAGGRAVRAAGRARPAAAPPRPVAARVAAAGSADGPAAAGRLAAAPAARGARAVPAAPGRVARGRAVRGPAAREAPGPVGSGSSGPAGPAGSVGPVVRDPVPLGATAGRRLLGRRHLRPQP